MRNSYQIFHCVISVQQQAVVSGYFFRCSVCNDTEKFVEEMKRMGVYVPDR